jgi:predicted Zn-dependent protease
MNAEQALTQAETAANRGDVAAAERTLRQMWPDMAKAPGDAMHLMATLRIREGKTADAEHLLRGAARAEPTSLRHQIALGHLLTGAGNHAGAADAYAEALRIDQKWPGLRAVYAQACYQAGRHEDAEMAARRLVKEAPSADAWDMLSAALRAQNKGKEALDAAEQALRFDANHHNGLNSRGAALLLLNRDKEALEVFDALAAQGVHAPVLALNRGAALEKLGRKAEAQAVYADAAQRWPHLPNLQAQLAQRRKQA